MLAAIDIRRIRERAERASPPYEWDWQEEYYRDVSALLAERISLKQKLRRARAIGKEE